MKTVIKERRLANIIDAAEDIFFEMGFAKANISDICKVAKCSRTTLYNHFDSKENIYLAVVKKSFKKFLSFFKELLPIESKALETVITLSKGYIVFSKKHPKHYQMVLDFHMILKSINNKNLQSQSFTLLSECRYFDEVQAIAKLPTSLLIEEIKKGQHDGSISARDSADVLFLNIWAYLIGVTNLANYSKTQNTISISGIKMKDWEKNTTSIIRSMLTV